MSEAVSDRKKNPMFRPEYERLTTDALLYEAWSVIANAGEGKGNWENESAEWVEAAMVWRDKYHALLAEQEGMRATMKTQPPILRSTETTLIHQGMAERTNQGFPERGYCLFSQEIEDGYPPVPIQVLLPWQTWEDMNSPSDIFVTVITGG